MATTPIKKMVALVPNEIGTNKEKYEFLLDPSDKIRFEFKSLRDILLLTESRVVSIDFQGIRGKKAEYMVIPYSKVNCFSLESAGTFDLDAEFKLWISGLGELEFQFAKGTDVCPIAVFMNNKIR